MGLRPKPRAGTAGDGFGGWSWFLVGFGDWIGFGDWFGLVGLDGWIWFGWFWLVGFGWFVVSR
jgi:hypothetical protein